VLQIFCGFSFSEEMLWILSGCQSLKKENANYSQVQELICIVVQAFVYSVLIFIGLGNFGYSICETLFARPPLKLVVLVEMNRKEEEFCKAF
jgi:hypothetical protein